jgi:4-amino-4-deoxy-L-arabinose transferase-like glycosyltransferase
VERDRRFGSRIAAIAALGAVWRLALVVDRWDHELLFNDSLYYSGWAVQLTEGEFFRDVFTGQPTAEHGPLTSVLMAPVSWLADPVPYQRLVTAACGVATIVLAGLLGRAIRGERVGIVAAAIAAAYPNLWINDGLVMSESVGVLLVTAVLLSMQRMLDEVTTGRVLATGALVGLAALARPELVLFLPIVIVALLGRSGGDGPMPRAHRVRATATVSGAAIVVMLVWVGPNLVRFEEPVLLSTNGGTTLLGSYCDASFEGTNLGGWTFECVAEHPRYAIGEDAAARDSWQRDEALDYLADHVGRLPTVVAARLLRTADLYGLQAMVLSDVGDQRPRWAVWSGIVSWWVLAPLAVLGARKLDRRRRGLLLAPVLIVVLVAAVFYGGHRIRSTLEPSVVVATAVAVVAAVDSSRWACTRPFARSSGSGRSS